MSSFDVCDYFAVRLTSYAANFSFIVPFDAALKDA